MEFGGTKLIRNGLVWTPWADERLTAKAEAIQKRWIGTRYAAGQCMPGAGVDCLRLCVAMLDEWTGTVTEAPPRLPQDVAMHDPELAEEVISILEKRYDWRKVTDGLVKPMDCVVSGRKGPCHGLMVGYRRNTMVEALPPQVCESGMIGHYPVRSVYRWASLV